MNELEAWIKEVGERVGKAIDGRWHHFGEDTHVRILKDGQYKSLFGIPCVTSENASFIAHARTDLPKALKIIDVLLRSVNRCGSVGGRDIGALKECDRIAKSKELFKS